MDSPTLQVFLSVMAGAFSVGNALPFINCVSAAIGAASAIFNVIDRIPEIDSYSNKGFRPQFVNGCIELKNVSFKYPARPKVEVCIGFFNYFRTYLCLVNSLSENLNSNFAKKQTIMLRRA